VPVNCRRIAVLALATLGAGLASLACATHEASPAFRRALLFDDRGISVPLPPPSLIDQPEQEVDLEGGTAGKDRIAAGTKLYVEDIDGDAHAMIELAEGATSFSVDGLSVDLRAHCFEVWLESPDGRETEHFHVRAHITSDTTLETTPACD